MARLQCHKLLWWMVQEPTAPELQADGRLQAAMGRGTRVTEIARIYVPGGVLVDLPYDAHTGVLTRTCRRSAMARLRSRVGETMAMISPGRGRPGTDGGVAGAESRAGRIGDSREPSKRKDLPGALFVFSDRCVQCTEERRHRHWVRQVRNTDDKDITTSVDPSGPIMKCLHEPLIEGDASLGQFPSNTSLLDRMLLEV